MHVRKQMRVYILKCICVECVCVCVAFVWVLVDEGKTPLNIRMLIRATTS